MPHEFIYKDEAGFNLSKAQRRSRNLTGHRAITDVPGQCGGNINLCAAISQNEVLHRNASMGTYDTHCILTFLDRLHNLVTVNDQTIEHIVIWDNVAFHRFLLLLLTAFLFFRGRHSESLFSILPYSLYLLL